MINKHAWLVSAALTVASTAAFAQEEPKQYPECTREPTEGDVAAAKGAFQAGQGSFNEADYARAITYWEDAYRRDCTAHALLLNLARAYELNGDKQQAVVALDTYLARNPETPQRDQIQRRVDKLREQIAAEQTAAPSTQPPVDGSSDAATPPPGGSTLPPPDTSSGGRPLTPLIVAGAGGGLALVGGIVYLAASSDLSDFEDQCPTRQGCPPGVEAGGNDARTRVNVGGGLFLGGLAVAAGGVIWYFVSEPKSGTAKLEPAQRVTPALGPGFAGLSYGGSF